MTSEQGYNAFGEPVTNAFKDPDGNPLWTENLTRDRQSRITTETSGGHTTTYDRDASGRLTSATRDGGTPVTYDYDANGNITATRGLTATYDGQDRLLTWGTTQYTYLASGERRSKTSGADTTTYDYDAAGNLRAATLPTGTKLTYSVDGQGRRVAVRRDDEVVARYIYGEALGPSAEVDAAGNVLTRYVYGARPNVPEYMVRGGHTFRFVLDNRGSVRAVLDAATGAVMQRLEYDAYGRVLSETGTVGFQPFGFAGGLWDRDSGLVHFGAREYDPEVGRFLSKDPVGFDSGASNLYAYAADDPVSFVDPSGQFIPLAIAAATLGGGLVNGAMEGFWAWQAGCSPGQIAAKALRGFAAGAVGTLVGTVATLVSKNPWVGGAIGGVAAEATSEALSGQRFDPVSLSVAIATGLPLGEHVFKTVGRLPNLWRPRGLGTKLTYGPNSQRIIGQNAVDSAAGNLIGHGGSAVGHSLLGCPQSDC